MGLAHVDRVYGRKSFGDGCFEACSVDLTREIGRQFMPLDYVGFHRKWPWGFNRMRSIGVNSDRLRAIAVRLNRRNQSPDWHTSVFGTSSDLQTFHGWWDDKAFAATIPLNRLLWTAETEAVTTTSTELVPLHEMPSAKGYRN
jgi:hypothetical protein